MINLRKKNQNGVYLCCSLLLGFIFTSELRAEPMNDIRYLASFKTTRAACMVRVNDFPMIDNFSYSSGTISTGFNITAFAENGKNKIEVLMGALDPEDKSTLYPDAKCELVITADTENNSQQITRITLSVDKQGEIISSDSSNYNNTQKEPRIDETQLAEDQPLRLHRVGRDVNLTNIPTWSWVNATPVSEKAIPKIQEVYRVIWNTMKARNIDLMKEMATISSAEMAITEGMTPDDIFKSYGLPENVMNSELSPINFNLSDYKLMTYCNGRVFRLAQGIDQNSPLRLQDKDGEIVFAYNPYFSIIKGKIFIIR
ncbi:hypothetical protein EDF81_3867 [Enterobacter sp. BIGb0383]|nr:hypothetical protein EDF81_3867 [Enterobacter sp. BIGb0383]ROS06051.1 hypothetical protein EC848_4007 [Enterobacter sp. BIGb0359]